jgi:uncharacterized protein YecE (DUF72 family)
MVNRGERSLAVYRKVDVDETQIYLGTQGWSYRDWVGPFYPPGSSSRDYLSHYSQVFDAVEVDTTFYGMPGRDRVELWRSSVPESFQFTAKVPRTITHDGRLVNAGREMSEFLQTMELLGDKLGPVLIQLPPDFKIEEQPALAAFVTDLPSDFSYAIEFRHRSWLTEATYDLLREKGIAWTMIDLSYMPRHVEVTADFSYVRWLGNRRAIQRVHEVQIDRRKELDAWAEKLDEVAKRVQRIYGFVNNHYSGHSPADVLYLQRRLGVNPRGVPEERPQQGSLL